MICPSEPQRQAEGTVTTVQDTMHLSERPHVQHPGGGVGALGEGVHALLGGKVGHQLLRLVPGGPTVDGAPAALQQQQLIEGLHVWATSGQA